MEFPTWHTVQGLLWLDANFNGFFDPASETLLQGVSVDLYECEEKQWKEHTTTDAQGRYQFVSVAPGEYYVKFFKPEKNFMRHDFTIPRAGRDNEEVIDSDVVHKEDFEGTSGCMEVGDGFVRLTNAGYRLMPTLSPTATPAVPGFCGERTADGEESETWNFWGCSIPCESPLHVDCPKGMQCVPTPDCS